MFVGEATASRDMASWGDWFMGDEVKLMGPRETR